MTRLLIVALAACLLAVAPAHAATGSDMLRARIVRLERSRDYYKRLANSRLRKLTIARQGAAGSLPAAVISVAQQGRVSLLEQLIIGPLRNNWPCWTFVSEDPAHEFQLQLELRPDFPDPRPPCYDDGAFD